jgi:hypothetical protein
MSEAEFAVFVERYNSLQASKNYWVDAGMALVEHLHKGGMKYEEIFKIAERRELTT